MIEWVTKSGIIDIEKECGLKPTYDCDHLHPGDGLIDKYVEASSSGTEILVETDEETGEEASTETEVDYSVTYKVISSEVYNGKRLVGLGNSTGEYIYCSSKGHVYGVVGVITDIQKPYPRGGLHNGKGTSTLLSISFTVRATDEIFQYKDRTFWIGVYHNWSVDRDKFIIENLGKDYLDKLQHDGYCNN